MPRPSIEPLLWMLFSAGGALAALVLPILALLFGVAFPLGWAAPPDRTELLALIRPALVRVALLTLVALALVHAAHRLRYTLYDGLQLAHLRGPIAAGCYGVAIAGSLWAAWLLWQVR